MAGRDIARQSDADGDAEDGRGGNASDTVTIEVIALRVLADVQFALDSAVLRPDALRTLTVALKTLNESPSINLHIEGYASPEGSPAYNKALGRGERGPFATT